MLCGTKGRPCPKISLDLDRATQLSGKDVPPPCLYLFPKSIPDPRNNPNPKTHKIGEVLFIERLYACFKCRLDDVVEVKVEAKMQGNDVLRRTIYLRQNVQIKESRWTKLKRAK